MDRPKQLNELLVLVNRAKRAGLTVHHYPENALAVIRVLPEKPIAASDTPPVILPEAKSP